MKRKRSRKNIVKSCDDLVRILLRSKQENCCEYCGVKVEGRNSQVHHIRSRKWYASRWDLRNLVLLCAVHHRQYHDGVIGKDWFKENYPLCWEWLEKQKQAPVKPWKDWELIEIENNLKQAIEDMK